MFKKFLVIILLAIASTTAMAQNSATNNGGEERPSLQMSDRLLSAPDSSAVIDENVWTFFVNDQGEYLVVKSRGVNEAFWAVVAAIEQAGYRNSVQPTGAKAGMQCEARIVDANKSVECKCHSDRTGSRPALSLQDQTTGRGYTNIVPMLDWLRARFVRASAALDIY